MKKEIKMHKSLLYKKMEVASIEYRGAYQDSIEAYREYEEACKRYEESRKKIREIDKVYKGNQPPIDEADKKCVFEEFYKTKKAQKKIQEVKKIEEEAYRKYKSAIEQVREYQILYNEYLKNNEVEL